MLIDESSTAQTGSLTPVFKHIEDPQEGKPISLEAGLTSFGGSFGVPIAREARRTLGRSGTLGGSDMSAYGDSQLDLSDADSDVPDELKCILAAHSDNRSVGLPFQEEVQALASSLAFNKSVLADNNFNQTHAPPVFRLTLADDNQNGFAIDGEGVQSSEEDTKKSFDFTGEIKKLNESDASDQASFVEQLEMAFKTPAKIDLHYDFGTHL
jgi:hypothetical protein